MKKIFTTLLTAFAALSASAQGWPANYQGVMLQGFYWDSYADTQWTNLESQANELGEFFRLVWIPQSGKSASEPSMGYNDLYWFSNYNSSFGNEAQLRSMIDTFKKQGIGTIADVVINHRSSLPDTWMGFPEETYKGVTYTMTPADICANDDNGKTAAQAEVKPTGANDTGDDFDGARDIDHTSTNAQTMIKAYLDFLLNDLGYAGFRYDMVKGYAAQYTGMYNAAANPTYSVGEYWDGNATALERWVSGTAHDGKIQSAAFDFALKYLLRDCCNTGKDWNKMADNYLANGDYKRYAVTFVDNHDTYQRGNDSETKANQLAANAFILAAPGTPCIFLPHWKSYKESIKQMIYARQTAGISNQSTTEQLQSKTNQYVMKVDGTDGKSVIVMLGSKAWPTGTVNSADYECVSKGGNYAYYLSKNAETAWTSLPSGTYEEQKGITLTAVSADATAQLVYTTDGTEPTAQSTAVANGTEINFDNGETILKVGLLKNGVVSGVITRHYDFRSFEKHDISIYVNTDNVGWGNVNFWSWGGDGTHAPSNINWPGDNVSTTVSVDGKNWFMKQYALNNSTDYVSFVFSTGTGSPQTLNVENIAETKYYEISASQQDGKYMVTDVTLQHSSGIDPAVSNSGNAAVCTKVYTIDGRMVRQFAQPTSVLKAVTGLVKGMYIVNHKKVFVR